MVESIFVYGFRVDEDRAVVLVSVVSSRIEKGLAVSEEGDIDFTGANFLISADNLELAGVVAERNIVPK